MPAARLVGINTISDVFMKYYFRKVTFFIGIYEYVLSQERIRETTPTSDSVCVIGIKVNFISDMLINVPSFFKSLLNLNLLQEMFVKVIPPVSSQFAFFIEIDGQI